MGLDITAYSRLEPIDPERRFDPDDCYEAGHVHAYAHDVFEQSYRGLRELRREVHSGEMFIEGGCYRRTARSEKHDFSAGSYGGYNQWRADLAQQFNPYRPGPNGGSYPDDYCDPDPQGPFYELIWFADNEGCIGPEAAADLLRDFTEHRDAYLTAHPGGDWRHDRMRECYDDWQRAASLAATGGLIRFH